ncbi:chromosome segregation atpase [Ophiostoma piceae UAMH 11346]|uniref:Chromosome segregation atpase n=1 Tax=Ophiostoma piceae (strain UAMH 11346) TaxID=1262450 RepID=S3BWI3_OPHP1|nr:chromosome segregation atpase [Ophiostoma piceae UAMH 11346]
MAPIERDVALYDADRVLRHQHSSSSDYGRSLIPMWDSSDPERAPPPLPMNPQSPSVGTSRPGTSTAIQNAHAALNEKARESSLMSNVLSKRMAETSPERTPRASLSYASSISSSSLSSNPSSASRSQSHRRMQSLHSGSVRDLSFVLDGSGRDSNNSTPRSPEKALRPATPHISYNDHDPFVDERPNPGPGPSLTPIVRPIVRRPQQSILGENTPPQSATMVALQNMATSSPSQRELPIPPISQPLPQPPAHHFPTPTVQPEYGPVPPSVSDSTNNSSAGGAASGRSTRASTGNTTSNMEMSISRQPTVAVENLSKQILSLTSIATSLQKEMAALSRRSRDNATDLMSLKEATNARDEDIRKSLREIITTSSEVASVRSRDSYPGGPFLIDNKPHHIHQSTTSPLLKNARPFSLPRIPSPNSFAASLDRDSMSTPSLCGNDGPNTIAMLERIVREMGTKEGQEMLLKRLVDVIEKLTGMASATKLEDLVQFVKERQIPETVVPSSAAFDLSDNASGTPPRPRNYSFDDSSPSQFEIEYSRNGPMAQRSEHLMQSSHQNDQRRSSAPIVGTADVISDDVLKIIKTVKDSVAQGGGLTAEVKALVRELRGEVLGMGREIGRRLDEVETNAREEGKPAAATQVEMAKVVEDGLSEMKQHMNNLMREHHRQSTVDTADVAAAAAKAVPGIDYEEVYNAMRAALKDARASKPSKQELSRDDVIEAVKDAWEMYKPEIEIQQIGLERDEVLACLEQGLRDYAPHDDKPAGATRDEVFKAVVEGMKHFVPPQMPPTGMSRDEVLGAVRECLEEFEFPVAPSAIGAEMTREDMVEAVKQGLDGFEFPRSSDRELVALHSTDNNNDDEVVTRLHEIMQFMREEFKAVSDEAKQNVAANGRDTEQVLDATRDGLEKLRVDLEGYVDKVAAAVTHQDFSEGLIRTLDVFRDEISELMSKATEDSKDLLKDEIDSLRDTVNSSLVPALPNASAAPTSNREVLEALQEGVNCLRGEISNRHVNSTSEVLDALQEGLQDLRISIDKLSNKPTDFSANDEILDALKSGLSDVRTDIDGLRDQNSSAVTTFESNNAIVPADMLRHDDIKNLESLITQLRTKVDVLDAVQTKLSTEREVSEADVVEAPSSRGVEEDPVWKEKLAQMESKLHAIHESVTGLSNRDMDIKLPEMESKLQAIHESVAGLATREPVTEASDAPPRPSTDAASCEDVEAIETILRNTKARLDDLIDGEQLVRKEHIDSIEAVVLETKHSLIDLKDLMAGLSSREDISMVESLVAQVASGFDEMKDRHEKHFDDPEKVTKTDVDAIALACLQVKSAVEKMAQADEETGLPSKDDLLGLAVIVRDVRDQLEMVSAAQTKATEDQQAEIVGVGERISDVKAFLEVLNETVKVRLEDGVLGMESVGKILDSLSDTMGRNNSDLHDLYETMKNEFEESRAGVVGVKLESDERFQQTTETLEAKIDERINDLMAKFDEFYAAADDKARIGEERDVEVEAAVVGTKTVAEELKLLVDTLGSAVTDSLEKMEEASKTVFTRVDDMVTKAEENHTDAKTEHQQTREQVQEALTVVQDVQGHVTEYHPQILDTIKDVLLVVNDHFEHSKISVVTMQKEIIDSIPEPPTPPPVEKYDDAMVHEKLDKLVSQTDRAAGAYDQLDKMDALVDHTLAVDAALAKIDRLVEHSDDTDKALVQLEKLDQLEKLEKLDYLVAQSDSTTETLTNLEKLAKLDQIVDLTQLAGRAFDAQHSKIDKLLDHTQTLEKVHEQVMRTATDLAQYMATQTQRIADDHEDREQTLRETSITLERRQAELVQADANLDDLREEERRLKESVASLRVDQESMQRNKIRLTADVSSLETALHLRREELHEMEARAEGLERRILEGVMDHSRVLLMAKANKGRDAMSRKRVVPSKKEKKDPSAAGARGLAAENKPRTAFNLAMSTKRNPMPANSPVGVAANGSANGSRRILSLSQINSSSSTGSIRRSNSVRANVGGAGSLRKSSWGGRLPSKGYGSLDVDKENAPLKESDEEDSRDMRELSIDVSHEDYDTLRNEQLNAAVVPYRRKGEEDECDDEFQDCGEDDENDKHSEAGTLRRSSLGTSVVTSDTQSESGEFYSGDEDDDVMSQWTSSQVSSAAPHSGSVPGEMVLYGRD